MKKVRISSKGQVVLPKSYREALGLTEGSEAVAVLRDRSIVLMNVLDFAGDSRGKLKGVWGKKRQEVDRLVDRERGSWE